MMESIRSKVNTPQGQLIAGLVDAVLLYAFVSISIDTASMFAYAACIFFLVTSVLHFAQAFKLWKGTADSARTKK